MARKRLDALMAERGLFESRSRAAAAVMAGEVRVGDEPARKPGQLVAGSLDCALLPFTPDMIVIDVSFISLTKVLPAVLACAAPRFDCLAMVKPQFEAGRDHVGRGGVVRDPEARLDAVVAVAQSARD